MKKSFTYHSPDGDRIVFLMAQNENGTVDLADADGNLDIGNCTIGKEIGQCSEGFGDALEIEAVEIGDEMTKEQIKESLDLAGVEYDARWGKDKLKELLESSN
jgi:hypothetical protein